MLHVVDGDPKFEETDTEVFIVMTKGGSDIMMEGAFTSLADAKTAAQAHYAVRVRWSKSNAGNVIGTCMGDDIGIFPFSTKVRSEA